MRAFAEQHATQEVAIAADWQEKWTAVRVRAQPIIEGLSDAYQMEEHVGPNHTIELDIEDEGYVSDAEDM